MCFIDQLVSIYKQYLNIGVNSGFRVFFFRTLKREYWLNFISNFKNSYFVVGLNYIK